MSSPVLVLPVPKPPRAERRPCPALTEADVVRLIMPKLALATGMPLKGAFAPAAMVAAAACARVYFHQAVLIRVGVHWSPDESVLIVPDNTSRPMPVLPIFQEAMIRLFESRGARDGMLLFASPDESEYSARMLADRVKEMIEQLGIDSREIVRRCHSFYDQAVRKVTEPDVRFALSGPYRPTRAPDPPPYEVPMRKLRTALEGAHPLNGPAGRYSGTRGRNWIAARPQNLPPEPTTGRLTPAPAFFTDPVVLAMKAVAWPAGEKAQQERRLELKKKHFAHLDDLRLAKKLRRREIAFLYRATVAQIGNWIVHRRIEPRPEDVVVRPLAEWHEIFLDEYGSRAEGETAYAVYRRVAGKYGCGMKFRSFKRILARFGVLKRRRGRPRKGRRR